MSLLCVYASSARCPVTWYRIAKRSQVIPHHSVVEISGLLISGGVRLRLYCICLEQQAHYIFFVYFLTGNNNLFTYFWLLLGVFLIGMGILHSFVNKRKIIIPKPVSVIFILLYVLGVLSWL